MSKDILYCGDTSLTTAACYLAGLLHAAGWTFDYVPSDRSCDSEVTSGNYRLYILSDYPAARIPRALQCELVRRLENGAGFLMIGGWESFQGSGGHWQGTPLGDALPVSIAATDDRRNCDSPVFVVQERDHPIVAGLPWRERPPLIGGYNTVTAKPESQVLLSARRFLAGWTESGTVCLEPSTVDPLLVVGEHGRGRAAALTTDLAPHWVGPMVDWGPERVTAQFPGAEAIEVGNLYARFVRQLVAWACG